MNVADPVLAEPLRPIDGAVTPPERPGTGIAWDVAAVRRYRMS